MNIEFDNLPVLPFADGFEDSSEFALHVLVFQYLATVLWCPDEMEL